MDLISWFLNLFLHLDTQLSYIIQNYGAWTYFILFTIIFIETGIVVAPYLPGDSLLFVAGTYAALGMLNLPLTFILLVIASTIGDSVNYAIGSYLGTKIYKKKYKWINMHALEKSKIFFDKNGAITIILARYLPIIRTFAPLLAGVSKMNYRKFFIYNVVGAILWVSTFMLAGYFFGNIPFVKENRSIILFSIIILTLIPVIIEVIKYYREMAEQTIEAMKEQGRKVFKKK